MRRWATFSLLYLASSVGLASPPAAGPVLIGGEPTNQMVLAGAKATFIATAIGTEPITYQWNRNGVRISGATSATYTTPPTSSADNGTSFTVTVTNSFNSPPASLTVSSVPVAPVITAHPQYSSVSQGNTASFRVFATGTGPVSYQWSKSGIPISGATKATYTTAATVIADNNATFTVTVTNSAGSVTSFPAGLFVSSKVYGLGGFRLLGAGYPYPFAPVDLTGVQYRFRVVTNTSQALKIVFGFNYLYAPGSAIGGYEIESNVYSGTLLYGSGGCTTWPPVGNYLEAYSSLRNATADYPFNAGQQPSVGSAINTSDNVSWPVQTYLVDNIPNLWKSDSISQFNINGIDARVTIQRGGTLTDISSFQRCGVAMLSGPYRLWTITTEMTGRTAVVNQIVVPDASARYIVPAQAMQFASEFLNGLGKFIVQYWDFAYMTESNPVWTPASTLMTNWLYDGSGQDFGVHVVNVNGQDRVEFSNDFGNSYLPGNQPFAIAPPSTVVSSNYFAHLALGGGWQTTLTYVNYSPQTVTCQTSFFSDSGTPLAVPFGGTAATTRTDMLAPGMTLHRESTADLTHTVVTGWAQAQCSGPVKANLLFRLYSQGIAVAEAGVNAMTAPASKFVTFAETQTGVAYANPSTTQPTTVTITALSAAGNALGSTNVTLLPGQHASANVGPLLNMSSFSGSVQITSTQPIVILSLNFEAFPAFSSLPSGELRGPISPGVTESYFSHLALGGGWQTALTYVNYSPQTVSCQTSFFSDSGTPLAVPFGGTAATTRTDTLAPGATLHQESAADLNATVVTGWAQAQCSGPVKANLLFRLYSQGVAVSEASVNAMAAPASKFVTFAETRTGIAYANPSATQPSTVTVTALNAAGNALGSTNVTLLPGHHGSANVGPMLNMSSFSGSVQITSTQPIVILSLNFEAFPAFSSLPLGDLDISTQLATGH